MGWLVDITYALAAVALAPYVLYHAWTDGKYRRDWPQRRGHYPDQPSNRRRVWFHAVSVGEVNAIRGLVDRLRESRPELDVIISTTTDTGIDRARQVFSDLTVIRYPLDFRRCVTRALARLKPTAIVLVELELWYNLVAQADARDIPVCVINGRLSERSVQRFSYVGPLIRPMFERLAWVGVQDETYRDRFERMGVPADRLTVTRSMKWDTAQITDALPGQEELAAAMGLDRAAPIWVCGSTGPDEEATILRARDRLIREHPNLQLVIVPRKPERFDEVAGLIRRSGLSCVRRSECPDGSERTASANTVLLGDTMGELRKFYALASVVFVGRTLAAMGGSDMMEVAALARPVIVGPHTENFADTMDQFRQDKAIIELDADLNDPQVNDRLARLVGELLSNAERAQELGRRGREVVLANRGAVERTLNQLTEILDRAQHLSS